MKRRQVLSVLAAGSLAAFTSGCSTFSPVYGNASPSGASAIRFRFAAPTSRIEQLVLNRLKLAFPEAATTSDPILSVSASSSSPAGALSDAFDVARPVNRRVEATISISLDGKTLFTATRFSDTSYQAGGKLTPANALSSEGAEETAARSVAEALRLAILAGYGQGLQQ